MTVAPDIAAFHAIYLRDANEGEKNPREDVLSKLENRTALTLAQEFLSFAETSSAAPGENAPNSVRALRP